MLPPVAELATVLKGQYGEGCFLFLDMEDRYSLANLVRPGNKSPFTDCDSWEVHAGSSALFAQREA